MDPEVDVRCAYPSAPLRAVAVRLPQNEGWCRRCERTCVLNAGKRCWLCCSIFQGLRELGGVASEMGLPWVTTW